MSDPTPEQRQLVSEDVIVYNHTAETLTVEKAAKYKDHIEDPKKMLKIAPKLGNAVAITHDGRLVADLYLRKLGTVANVKRAMGKCNQIVVIP